MTMHEQELTLFGGWAKAQIPQPIEVGAVKPSVTLSVSIYIKGEMEEPLSLNRLEKLVLRPYFEFQVSNDLCSLKPHPNPAYVLSEYNFDPDIQIEQALIKYYHDEEGNVHKLEENEMIYPQEKREQNRWGGWKSTKWEDLVYQMWMDHAFLRFFEIWSKGMEDDIVRAYLGTLRFRRSISGKIGGNYAGGDTAKEKSIIKSKDGKWILNEKKPIYPRLLRLPEEGIQNARRLAWEMRRYRSIRERGE